MRTTLPFVEHITQETFDNFARSSPKAIVLIGIGQRHSFLEELLKYFSTEYRNEVKFGYLDHSRIPFPGWALKHVGDLFTRQPTQPTTTPNGYYLFANGDAVGFHPGITWKQSGTVLGIGAVFSAFGGSMKPLEVSIEAIEKKAAEGVIAFFEHLLQQHQPTADRTGPATSSKAKREKVNPYSVLGIKPTANDVQIQKAYKQQIQANHPDKVAHLSEEIKSFAQERTKAINEAYETVKTLRGNKRV